MDKRYLLGEEQYVMWAAGPVGSIGTTLGSLAVPFRHYSRASVSGKKLEWSIVACSLLCDRSALYIAEVSGILNTTINCKYPDTSCRYVEDKLYPFAG